jgi:hypothetical protein
MPGLTHKEGNSTGQSRRLAPRAPDEDEQFRAGAAGSLLAARVRHWRTSRQWGSQVLTNWSMLTGWVGMGLNSQKSFAHLCTRLHMPGHFLHMPEHAQTCLYMPERSCTTLAPPSPMRKPLCEWDLHHWTYSSSLSWRRQMGLDEWRRGLDQTTCVRARASREEQGLPKKFRSVCRPGLGP